MGSMSGSGGCPFGGQEGVLGPLPGFRHIFGEPRAAERMLVDGEDPRQSARALATLRRRMRGLAMLMGNRPARSAENPGVPAGYTYVLQLAAHDLVATTIGLWAAGGMPAPGTANAIAAPLRLETLYGAGPGGCPFAYAPDDLRDAARSRFRLSAIGDIPAATPGAFRDIGRAATPGTLGTRPAMAEPLVADRRNDQSAQLSQTTALFQMLHNAILAMLPPIGPMPATQRRVAEETRFATARDAVTLIWRAILRADVLPRILHPAVLAAYAVPGAACLDQPKAPGIPLEFSHGAFRFGHAMPRDTYRIGDFPEAGLDTLLRLSSARAPNLMPMQHRWMIAWSQFFALPGMTAPNASMKLGPRFSPRLIADGLLGPIETGAPFGVAFRDLMSAGLAGLRSVPALAALLLARRPALAGLSPMLADPAARQAALTAWLSRAPALSRFAPADVAALAADPPLPFYVLFEAEQEAAGDRLGILGSILVAETIFGILARDPLPSELGEGGLDAALDRLCAARYGAFRFPDRPDITTMPDLIGFLARRLGLASVEPAFL